MGVCKLIVIFGVAALVIQSSNAASIGGQSTMCLCTKEYEPVCGSNGRTYSNECVFNCEKSKLNDLKLMFYGDCDEQAADEEICLCTREYEPICGTDGETYSNKCMFKCAQNDNDALKFSSFGECVQVSDLDEDPCLCTREYDPVCGNDGETYSNRCMFNCAKNTNQNLEMLSSGECTEINSLPLDSEIPNVQTLPLFDDDDDDVMCPCAKIYDPVCGTDGSSFKTYSNKCTFDCAQRTNEELKLFAEGVCN